MKPHPRIRKTVKWGGAVVSVVLLVVWVVSGWYTVYCGTTHGWDVYFNAGMCDSVYYPNYRSGRSSWYIDRRERAFSRDPAPFTLVWTFPSVSSEQWSVGGDPATCVRIPLWTPVALSGLATTMAWRLDTLARRRARVGLCRTCSYDRTGLAPGAVCPECGAAASAPSPNS